MEYDFFVSYASEDDARALELVDSLRQSGYRCFYDRAGIPGGAQSYRGVLADAICDAETILVLLSPHSQASLEVRDEVQLATNHGRRKAAVSLPGEVTFTSRALELLLTSVQVITWGDRAVADVVSDVGAQRTLNQLRSQLGDYASITDKMRLDFAGIFVAVEADQREEAARHVAEVTRSLLSDLWHEYRPADIPPPDRIEHLIKGCRDHFETSEMTKAFTRVQGLLAAAGLKVPTLDSIRECLEQLVRVLSFLRSRRHIDADIAPELRADANFLSGLLLAAGWIVGEEIVPSPDTVYLLGEKPTVAGKRYLEVVLGRDPRSIHALAATAAGGILRPTDGPATTRFLVCGEGPDEVGEEWPVLSLATFVDRLTGFSNGWPPEIELRRDRGAESLARRQNAFIYGATRTGKTALLGHLSRGDWPDRPRYTAYIDLAVGAQSDPLTRFQESLEGHFPEHVRSRSAELASYLVRHGWLLLLVDAIELLALVKDPAANARGLAQLCSFLSARSAVFLAGRDAPLRDSPAIREFFLGEHSGTDTLTKQLDARGVDVADLPAFVMHRTRRQRLTPTQVRTPADRLHTYLDQAAWDNQEDCAAAALREIVGSADLRSLVAELPPMDATSIELAAAGRRAGATAGMAVERGWGTRLGDTRSGWEFRAALDYVRTAVSGVAESHWDFVGVSDATRRFVRQLSFVGEWDLGRAYRISLVGPPGQTLAIHHGGPMRLAQRPCTTVEYTEFLRSGRTGTDAAELVEPFHDRLPERYFADPARGEHPAVGVSWFGAKACADWLGARLPSSLEWEVAARGWDGAMYPWGDTVTGVQVRCAETSAGRPLLDYVTWREAMRTNDVAPMSASPSRPGLSNVNAWGCLDLVGNVWEWTSTASGPYRAIAGGSYDNPLRACTLYSRSLAAATTRSNAVGFRVAWST